MGANVWADGRNLRAEAFGSSSPLKIHRASEHKKCSFPSSSLRLGSERAKAAKNHCSALPPGALAEGKTMKKGPSRPPLSLF